jgi:hypothetical protein
MNTINLAPLCHGLRWIALDALGFVAGPAAVVSTIEALPETRVVLVYGRGVPFRSFPWNKRNEACRLVAEYRRTGVYHRSQVHVAARSHPGA